MHIHGIAIGHVIWTNRLPTGNRSVSGWRRNQYTRTGLHTMRQNTHTTIHDCCIHTTTRISVHRGFQPEQVQFLQLPDCRLWIPVHTDNTAKRAAHTPDHHNLTSPACLPERWKTPVHSSQNILHNCGSPMKCSLFWSCSPVMQDWYVLYQSDFVRQHFPDSFLIPAHRSW